MAAYGALFDANVLYPAGLRNFLMHLALTGLFRAYWSAEIHEEWIRNVLKNRPDLTREKLERTRSLMEKAVPDALVTDHEHLIDTIILPDRDDRHVLAAAIHCGASVIVTLNLSDFPKQTLQRFNIEAQHPDDFVSALWKLTLPSCLRQRKIIAPASRTRRRLPTNTLQNSTLKACKGLL